MNLKRWWCPQSGLLPKEGYRIAIDMDEMKDPLTTSKEQQGCCPELNAVILIIPDLISIEVISLQTYHEKIKLTSEIFKFLYIQL